jgi:hypothetical protein
MTKRLAFGFCLTVLSGSLVGVWAVTARVQALAQAPAPQCSLAQKGRFDQGWLEEAQSGAFRCMATYDENLKPSGAAWVKVNPDGTVGSKLPR